jgi:hypothetical protein
MWTNAKVVTVGRIKNSLMLAVLMGILPDCLHPAVDRPSLVCLVPRFRLLEVAVRVRLATLAAGLLMVGVGCGGANSAPQNSGANFAGTNQGSNSTQNSQNNNQSPPQPGQNAALPTPPSNATVIDHIERMSHWESCNTQDCSGGSGNGEFWMAANQASPSLSGGSFELHNSGAWSDALWWNKFGAYDSATNFLWDFYFQVDAASTTAAQALEFDAFQFLDGYNYMMGSQCDYGRSVWEVWDEADGKWIQTNVACPKFSPGNWHHVQWYLQRNANTAQYTFVTLVVDGTSYAINRTYSAKNLGWSANLGVQYELDVNASGQAFEAWIDQSSLTVW